MIGQSKFSGQTCGATLGRRLTPDGLGGFGVIDEGVPVLLNLENRVISGNFLAGNRIVLAPLEVKGTGPGGQVAIRKDRVAPPRAAFIAIARRHVEIGPGDVAFIFVDGFEDVRGAQSKVRRGIARAKFGTILTRPFAGSHDGVRIIGVCDYDG